MDRMKDEVDKQLKTNKLDLGRDRSCVDQMAALHIIKQQSSSLHVNFVDLKHLQILIEDS